MREIHCFIHFFSFKKSLVYRIETWHSIKIKSVAYISQGSHTGHYNDWQIAVRRDNVISITHQVS